MTFVAQGDVAIVGVGLGGGGGGTSRVLWEGGVEVLVLARVAEVVVSALGLVLKLKKDLSNSLNRSNDGISMADRAGMLVRADEAEERVAAVAVAAAALLVLAFGVAPPTESRPGAEDEGLLMNEERTCVTTVAVAEVVSAARAGTVSVGPVMAWLMAWLIGLIAWLIGMACQRLSV